jgi:ABC-type antimicrobial peptide transport system permease subunit
MDENLPQYNVKTMREHLTVALIPATLGATVLGIVSTIALTLASLGLYGMLAYAVEQRTYEIGVRRALGAENLDVIALVVRQAMTLVFIGLVTGIVLSLLGARVIVSLLYGVQATDPFALGLACLVLAVVSLLACYVPAYRATRIQAVKALRYE